MNSIDLGIVWVGIIAFAVFAYVLMDGFDLGIGILFPILAVEEERAQAMNSIAPVWDGNETWLVLGGGGLFAAFPLAYAIILPATYPLMIAMLLGLVFRGVAFEFRWRYAAHRRIAFPVGIATLVAMAAVSAATPFLDYDYWRRWFTVPGVFLTAQVPLLVVITAAVFFWSLRRGAERLPFLMVLAQFRRPWHQRFSLSRPPPSHHLGRRRTSSKPEIHVGRNRRHISGHTGLHCLGLLGISRQSRHPWVSLMRPA